MRTYWWVMGGTSSGKKTLIARLLSDPELRAAVGMNGTAEAGWIQDGPVERLPETYFDNLLLRWQWGRQEVMRIAAAACAPETAHRILLTWVDARTQHAWAKNREGSEVWTEVDLMVEAASIRDLVIAMSSELSISVTVVDTRTMTARAVQSLEEIYQCSSG